MKKTVCELFAGVGGFRVGLERAGKWNTLIANQWEPNFRTQFAYDCYTQRFKEKSKCSNIDVSTLELETLPDFNLLVGGFPCQDYSVATTGAKGIQGKKGVLWWEIYNIVDQKRPPFLLLENVDRLLKSPSLQRGRDFGIILSCLYNLGYGVEWRVINAADYGNPQRRRRVFIFAFHRDTNYFKTMDAYENFTDIVSDYGLFAKQFPVVKLNHQIEEKLTHFFEENHYVDVKNISDTYNHKFENSGVMINAHILTVKQAPLFNGNSKKLRDVLESNVDETYYLTDAQYAKAKIEKGSKSKERIKKDGFVYNFSEGAIPFPEPLDAPSRTMLTSEGKVSRTSHIILDPITNRYRFITPLECERLNGFDDNWTNTGMTNSQRYFCMGNALVVPVITQIGKELNNIFDREPN